MFRALVWRTALVRGCQSVPVAASSPIGVVTLDASTWKLGDRKLVEYVRYGDRALGLVVRPSGRRRWTMWVEGGSTVAINRDQMVFQFPDEFALHLKPPVVGFFDVVESQTADILKSVVTDPKDVWLAFVNTDSVSLDSVAVRLFGSESVSPLHYYAAYRYLASQRVYFRYCSMSLSCVVMLTCA